MSKSDNVWMIGVGGMGLNTINRIGKQCIKDENIIAISDKQESLDLVKCENKCLVPIDKDDPDNTSIDSISFSFDTPKKSVVFVVNGLGGDSEACVPSLIKKLKADENTVIAVVTEPFYFEDMARINKASFYKNKFKEETDILVAMPNEHLMKNLTREDTLFSVLNRQSNIVKDIIDRIKELACAKENLSEEIFLCCTRHLIQDILDVNYGNIV